MSMINVALVVESPGVPSSEVKRVAAAVQRQLSRDVGPIWGVSATIDPFAALEDVPPGYWPVLVADGFRGMDIIGIHQDERGQPFALVRRTPTWSLTVSHEVLEMITDPWGSRLVPGGSPRPGQGLVEYLLEICDPCGGVAHAYTVNGVLVSDFVTPAYHDPVAVPGGRYSYTGVIPRPRGIAPGGYLAWRDPTDRVWWAWNWVNRPEPVFQRLGMLDEDGVPLRQLVDAFGINNERLEGASPDDPNVIAARERERSTLQASAELAARLRVRIDRLTGGSGFATPVPVAPRPGPSGTPETGSEDAGGPEHRDPKAAG